MTSPYLDKPRRELEQALRDCGRSHDAVGGARIAHHARYAGIRSMTRGSWYIVYVATLLATGAIVATFGLPIAQLAQQPNPNGLSDIEPASGPSATVPMPHPEERVFDFGTLPVSGLLEPEE